MLYEIPKKIKPSELKKYLGRKVVSFNKKFGNTDLNNSKEVYLGAFNKGEEVCGISLLYKGHGGHSGAWSLGKIRWEKIDSFDHIFYSSWNFSLDSKIVIEIGGQLEFEF